MSMRTWFSLREIADEAACAPQLVHVSRDEIVQCLSELYERAAEWPDGDDPARRWRGSVSSSAPAYKIKPRWCYGGISDQEWDEWEEELYSPHFTPDIDKFLPEFLGRTCLLCGGLDCGTHNFTCHQIDWFLVPGWRELASFGPLYCRHCGKALHAFARQLGAEYSPYDRIKRWGLELKDEESGSIAVAMLVASRKFRDRAEGNSRNSLSWRFDPRRHEREHAELVSRRGWA